MRKAILLALIVLGVLSVASTVYGGALAIDEDGTVDIVLGQETDTQLTKTTQAANVTIMNVSTTIQTTHWAAFLGNVSATVALSGNQATNIFEFQLNSTNLDAIAATTDSNFDWGSFQTIAATDADEILNLSTGAADSVTNSFDDATETILAIPGLLTQHLRNNSGIDSAWPTSVATDTGSPAVTNGVDDMAFLADLTDGSAHEDYLGGDSEYQLLVGINETDAPGLQVELTYNFWLVEN